MHDQNEKFSKEIDTIKKKKQMEILEPKKTMTKLKNLMENLGIKLD